MILDFFRAQFVCESRRDNVILPQILFRDIFPIPCRMRKTLKSILEHLQDLAKQSPVFSPGVENYFRMGHLDAVWQKVYTRPWSEVSPEPNDADDDLPD